MDWKRISSLLFTDKVWNAETAFASMAWKRLVRFVKLVRITLDTFAENRMGFQCTALSYCMTLAMVPFAAFMMFVSSSLRIFDWVESLVRAVIPENIEMVDLILDKAQNIVDAMQSGPVGVVSALMFIWTVIWMMFQVERVFNNVWGIRKVPRKIYKRFGFYIGLLFLSPFIVIIFCYGIVLYTNAANLIGWSWRGISRLVGWIIFYGILVFTLSAMYKYIPAVKVEYRHAIKAALFDAAVFLAFQYLYLETQTFVGRLNAVYGVLAAIPLFLIWLNYSWQIVIYGAELTYSLQHVDDYHISE